ncbi:MAG: nicotinate (nicotinamide) nucleotide adenylyltransferase [Patescibacteria group bacterium]
MKIILFGGAFDPPHLGHHSITKNILDLVIADQVWYVPAKTHPFAKKLTADHHRLAMLEFLVADDPRTKIETYELDKAGISYSHETLDALAQKYPEHEFSWLIGSDNLAKFHLWGDSLGRDFKQMLAKYHFFVYPRKGYPFSPLYDNMTSLTNMQEIEVSSTLVRQKVANGEDISAVVKDEIIEYIKNNNLYR